MLPALVICVTFFPSRAIVNTWVLPERVDVNTGVIEAFAVNRGKDNGPASKLGTGGLARPLAARFDNTGEALYVVDFGVLTMEEGKPKPRENTGVLWRITREGTGTASAAEGSR